MQPTTDPLLTWLSNAGALGILAFGCIAFIRGWIVPGSTFQRVLAERDSALATIQRQIEDRKQERDLLRHELDEERKRYRDLERRFNE